MKTCLLALSLISLSSCCSKKGIVNQTLKSSGDDFITILKESNTNMIEEGAYVIDNNKDLKSLYEQINATRSPNFELPVVDFKNQSVIVASMGQKTTGGFSFTKVKVNKGERTEYIIYSQSPGPQDRVTTAMTTPGIVLLANQPAHSIQVIIK
ncbi:protease complex subunit PrcB family protein [uncultured Nonlabens sp.]|uniref:protease complex subunit PrcB family protein n=1 Tax=uncultured Nonlabens sp. TaxID=859306 RepID=UPI00260224A6|nr:protease complex subunit PrcB family protein [uncultured Nonlabens sp.]